MVFAQKFAFSVALSELIFSIVTMLVHLAVPTPSTWTLPMTAVTIFTVAASGFGMCALNALSTSFLAFYTLAEVIRFLFYALFVALAYPEPLYPWVGIYTALVVVMGVTILLVLVQLFALTILLASDWEEEMRRHEEEMLYFDYKYGGGDDYDYYDEAQAAEYYYDEVAAPVASRAMLEATAKKAGGGKAKRKAGKAARAARAAERTNEGDVGDGHSDEESSEPVEPVQRSKTCLPKSLQEVDLPADIDEVVDEIKQIWTREMPKTAIFKDLCRLARRFVIKENGETVVPANADSSQTVASVLANIVNEVARRVETKKRASAVKKATAPWLELDSTGNSEAAIEKTFVDEIGLESKTSQVFRSVHQGTVMPVVKWLRKKTRVLSKDVTSADGWTIHFNFVDDRVEVTHLRKEQSLVPSGDEHFVLQYRARLHVLPQDDVLAALTDVEVDFVSILPDRRTLHADVRAALKPLTQWQAVRASQQKK